MIEIPIWLYFTQVGLSFVAFGVFFLAGIRAGYLRGREWTVKEGWREWTRGYTRALKDNDLA